MKIAEIDGRNSSSFWVQLLKKLQCITTVPQSTNATRNHRYWTNLGKLGTGDSPPIGPRLVCRLRLCFGDGDSLPDRDALRCGDPLIRRVFAAMRLYRSVAAAGVRDMSGLADCSPLAGSGEERVGTGESGRLA